MACSLKDCPSPEAMAATTVGSVSCVAALDDGFFGHLIVHIVQPFLDAESRQLGLFNAVGTGWSAGRS